MTKDVTDMDDFFGEPLNESKNKFVLRYNHSISGFDMVSADGVLVKQTETSLPVGFLTVMESELKLEDITEIGDVDAGQFIDY
tara:strand:+ start:762 stop:1010 length:249 start_codon:yes stop_codon:yes gene_type:complete